MMDKDPHIQQRIRTHLSKEDARELRRLRKLFGFRSDYQLVQSSVLIVLRLLQKAERRRVERLDESTIEEAFDEFADWEAPELGRRQRKGCRSDSLTKLLFGISEESSEVASSSDYMVDQNSYELSPEVEGWYQRFYELYYERLFSLFSNRPQTPTADGLTPLDLFHETLLRLRFPPHEVASWADYERYALAKFHQAPGSVNGVSIPSKKKSSQGSLR